MEKIFRHIIYLLMGVVLAALTGGCESQTEPQYIDGGVILLSADSERTMHIQSRDGGSTPSVGDTISSIVPETIGVFGSIDDIDVTVFDNQKMYYKKGTEVKNSGIDVEKWDKNNDWPYTPTRTWVAERNYSFYGYAPYDVEKTEMLATGYKVRTFYFHDIPPLGAIEYMVAKNEARTTSGTRPNITLTHITSRLRFMFAVGEKYDELRNIRVKSIKISDSGNNTPYWECSVELNGLDPTNDPEIEVVKSEKIYRSDEDIQLIAENESSDPTFPGLLLSTEYSSFSSAYNLLGQIPNTILTVVYDVYDKEDLLLRQDQAVSNIIDLSVFGEFGRGLCYDVKVLITPKYLYVLSDNDVKPNGVMFVND